ncbi:MAG TPA: hypothetical protein PKN95_10295 [Verrucomicrobiota bacterium]|nr:hypothetical protein [Verrucomicrobiota bacterium]HNT15496.1 hypothetical protein [Verrucomicrobiota bacterium]
MGFITSWFRSTKPLLQLYTGSFSIDRTGQILATTIPSSFPNDLLRSIGQAVMRTFNEAQAARLSLGELVIHFPGLKITAREMRGGAFIFLTTPQSQTTYKRKQSLL